MQATTGKRDSSAPGIAEEFTAADENYYIILSETIDGIPFSSDMNWVKDKRQVDTGTGILMTACYNQKCGLSSLHIRNYCEILAPIGDLNIISPEQALNAYVDNYEQSEHSTSTTITGIELNYLVFVDGESLTALPCWMIHTKRIISEDYINPSTNAPFYEYPLYAVSADTGILLTDNEAKNS